MAFIQGISSLVPLSTGLPLVIEMPRDSIL